MASIFEREFFGLQHTSKVIPIDQRRCCPNCGKRLNLWTVIGVGGVQIVGQPSVDIPADAKAWSSVKLNDDGSPKRLAVWTGKYDAYRGLFCKQDCAVAFATDAFMAGCRRPATGGRAIEFYPKRGK